MFSNRLWVNLSLTRSGGLAWTLQWRHIEPVGVSNHQPHQCLLSRLFRRRSKKTSKFRVAGLCEGNSPVTGEFPALMASNAENVSISWRHHETKPIRCKIIPDHDFGCVRLPWFCRTGLMLQKICIVWVSCNVAYIIYHDVVKTHNKFLQNVHESTSYLALVAQLWRVFCELK